LQACSRFVRGRVVARQTLFCLSSPRRPISGRGLLRLAWSLGLSKEPDRSLLLLEAGPDTTPRRRNPQRSAAHLDRDCRSRLGLSRAAHAGARSPLLPRAGDSGMVGDKPSGRDKPGARGFDERAALGNDWRTRKPTGCARGSSTRLRPEKLLSLDSSWSTSSERFR
jgi:hypothetical protein